MRRIDAEDVEHKYKIGDKIWSRWHAKVLGLLHGGEIKEIHIWRTSTGEIKINYLMQRIHNYGYGIGKYFCVVKEEEAINKDKARKLAIEFHEKRIDNLMEE